MIALDASALLAMLFREKGQEHVAAVIDRSCISAVNVSEVIGRFVRDGHEATEALQLIGALPIGFCFDRANGERPASSIRVSPVPASSSAPALSARMFPAASRRWRAGRAR